MVVLKCDSLTNRKRYPLGFFRRFGRNCTFLLASTRNILNILPMKSELEVDIFMRQAQVQYVLRKV